MSNDENCKTEKMCRKQARIQTHNLFAAKIDSKDNEEIHLVTIQEILSAKITHSQYINYFTNKPFKNKDPNLSLKVISNIRVIIHKDHRMVIATVEMQDKVLKWYHHYLQHPGANRLIETLCAVGWWSNMRAHIEKLIETCNR